MSTYFPNTLYNKIASCQLWVVRNHLNTTELTSSEIHALRFRLFVKCTKVFHSNKYHSRI